ncbi:class I SAM-dependent methyltransferase [Saccharothrix coeruleofusca]|nr:class I SAM-dependent methyltransferase [Saccharothrix coeruleofusca]MBP2335774.1 SAM-dependent methyltransferase [Saccharothrix coeruleofusca]
MAESFGVDAERYDRTRPPYPEALVRRVVTASPGKAVLDVGCGTGIAARQFRDAGCHVLGVEPDARMAEFARRGGIAVEVATFEDWDAGARRFDAVVAGQAWHWVDPVAGAAKAVGVLRPGGRLAAFWHAFELPAEVTDALAAAYRQALPDLPLDPRATRREEAYEALLDRAADGMRAAGGFGAPERWRFDWERTYTRDEWLDQLPTSGVFTRLPADGLARVLEAVGAAVDEVGGGFTARYATKVITAVRTGDA